MKLYDLITSRRTIREFEPKPVSRELLERFVDAGRLAPQAANRQPLEFIVVDDPALCEKLFSLVAFAGYLDWNPPKDKRPQVYVAILIDTRIQGPKWAYCDVACAAENIALAAWGDGVGSCMIGSFKKEEVQRLLGVPENYDVSLLMALGYPAHKSYAEDMKGDSIEYWRDEKGEFHVPKRPLKKILHYNRF
jgi:nitroreductase